MDNSSPTATVDAHARIEDSATKGRSPAHKFGQAGGSVITNWCGTHALARGQSRARPENETQLQEVVGHQGAGHRIQILGSRYTWPRLIQAADDALVVDMNGLSGVLGASDDTVSVASGTTIAEVSAFLRSIGRRIACSPAVIASQTVAGAIGTATHGQGLGQATLGDAVTEMRLIDPQGETLAIDRSNPHFGAYQAHLGCLGIITQLTLSTVDDVVHVCEKRAVPYKTFERHFEEWNRTYDYCKAWWFPESDLVHVWLVREDATSGSDSAVRPSFNDDANIDLGRLMAEAVDLSVDRMKTQTKSTDLSRGQFRTVGRFRQLSMVRGNLDDLLCQGIPVPQINCEIGVPLAQFQHVQEILSSWYRRRHPELHYPIILRPTGPSRAWLSSAYGRETCHYGFVVYQAEDGTFRDDAFEYLTEIQELLASVGGIPHYGKFFLPEVFALAQRAEWKSFSAVQRKCDPNKVMGNDFVRSILSN